MDKAMARDASIEVPEKLGSINVSESGVPNSGPQLRTSARVHKKMRLDPSLASERKDSESKDEDGQIVDMKDGKAGKTSETKPSSKSSDQANNTPVTLKIKRSSPSWSGEEKDTFFQALNEYGKDFESIHSVFIAKAHEKNFPENLVKSKEQIRLFYYRTWHKLSKHLKFDPDVKRAIQELYALINYGEFRKNVGFVTEKTCVKLNDLILRGHTHFRIRGKHVRVKTPQCPALQKLNRLDVPEWKEELQLPSHVVVELRPRTASDWCRVQSVAQNPRVRTLLPLEQRLSSLLAFLQQRWRPPLLQHMSISLPEISNKKPSVLGKDVDTLVAAAAAAVAACEAKAKASAALTGQTINGTGVKDNNGTLVSSGTVPVTAAVFASSSGVVPLLANSISTSKVSVTSASAVTEASVGITSKATKTASATVTSSGTSVSSISSVSATNGISLISEAKSALEDNSEIDATGGKKATESTALVSGTEVTRAEPQKETATEVKIKGESGAVSEAEVEVKADAGTEAHTDTVLEAPVSTEIDVKTDIKVEMKMRAQARREKAAARLEVVRQGWSLENACAVTIGELYLMFGHDGRVELEYWWEEKAPPEQTTLVGEKGEVSPVASALQKLVSITKLNYRKSKLLCPCGHVCGAPTKASSRSKSGGKNAKETQDKTASGSGSGKIAPKPQPLPPPPPPPPAPRTIPHHMILPTVQDGVFRRPLIAPLYRTTPRSSDVEAIKAQLEKFRPKYCNRRGRTVRQKGVVVQRMLPLLPKAPDGHTMLALKVIPQTTSKMAGEFIPIRPQPDGYSLTHAAAPPISSLRIRPKDSGVIRRQQSYLAPKLFTSAPVTISTTVPTVESKQEQQTQEQITVTVSLAPSATSLSQSISAPLIPVDPPAGEIEMTLTKEEEMPLSPPPMSSPPPSISHLLDMDLGSTAGDDISLSGVSCGLLDAALVTSSTPSSSQTFSGLLSDECPASPLLKLPDQHWLNSEVGDISLSSLLGHLDSPLKTNQTSSGGEDVRLSDVETQMQCLMSENSVDYSAKFAVLAAQSISKNMKQCFSFFLIIIFGD
ncbi:Protein cramped [Gryllus bimaculatus]|nr:Protein cramped [Gryllus bimaculatus]